MLEHRYVGDKVKMYVNSTFIQYLLQFAFSITNFEYFNHTLFREDTNKMVGPLRRGGVKPPEPLRKKTIIN